MFPHNIYICLYSYELSYFLHTSFKFTKLVEDDPTCEFKFTLKMDDSNDNYILANVNPTLDTARTDILLIALNADGKSGFHLFVVGMSK